MGHPPTEALIGSASPCRSWVSHIVPEGLWGGGAERPLDDVGVADQVRVEPLVNSCSLAYIGR